MKKRFRKLPSTRYVAHYLHVLGLNPDASWDDVELAYFTFSRGFKETESARVQERIRQIKHAYAALNQSRRTQRVETIEKEVNRFLMISVIVLFVLASFSGFQLSDRIRPYLVDFEIGDVVYRRDDNRKAGVILSYEKDHPFPAGFRRDAYQVNLLPSDTEAWISVHTAHNAFKTK